MAKIKSEGERGEGYLPAMIRFLQINTDNSTAAFDLAVATARLYSVDIILANEQHHCERCWFPDALGKAAVAIVNDALHVDEIGPGDQDGFRWIQLHGVRVICCYWSPNRDGGYDDFLKRLEACVRASISPVIMAGDFNAKSHEWGSPVEDTKGTKLAELAASLELVVCNRPSLPTFIRSNPYAESWMDVTFASERLISKINDWRVSLEYSASYHRHILFTLEISGTAGCLVVPCQRRHREWITTSDIDVRSLEANLTKIKLTSTYTVQPTAEQMAVRIEDELTAACDLTLQRRKQPPTRRPQVHWWTQEIAELRKAYIAARRAVTRAASKQARLPDARSAQKEMMIPANLLQTLREARRARNLAIKLSKERCRKEIVDLIERDPWGNGQAQGPPSGTDAGPVHHRAVSEPSLQPTHREETLRVQSLRPLQRPKSSLW